MIFQHQRYCGVRDDDHDSARVRDVRVRDAQIHDDVHLRGDAGSRRNRTHQSRSCFYGRRHNPIRADAGFSAWRPVFRGWRPNPTKPPPSYRR